MEHKTFRPQILVAMPALQDGYFDKSVVLLCDYDEHGAMGFVINSPSTTTVSDLLRELGYPEQAKHGQTILIGGPVQCELCWVVHSNDFKGSSTAALGESLCLSAAQEVLTGIVDGSPPRTYEMGVGYAGWAAGQLDQEIELGAWWLCDLDPLEVLMRPAEQRWQLIMETLGLNNPYVTYLRA